MKRAVVVCIVAAAFVVLLGSVGSAGNVSGQNKVFVSIIPQAYFVERIGGDYIKAEVLVGPGQSPATYEPTPKQMARLGRSKLYFRIGVPFEKVFIPKISSAFPDLHIVDTSAGVPLQYFSQSAARQVADPHIWLDPKLVKIQAETICNTLVMMDPGHADVFIRNLKAFQHDLDMLDKKISRSLAPLERRRIYVFHPAFGYFARSYGLQQIAIEMEGKEPSARQMSELINRARAEKVRIIFVQPQYSQKNAQTIASAIGGAVVPINPLPKDFIAELETMAQTIKDAMSKE